MIRKLSGNCCCLKRKEELYSNLAILFRKRMSKRQKFTDGKSIIRSSEYQIFVTGVECMNRYFHRKHGWKVDPLFRVARTIFHAFGQSGFADSPRYLLSKHADNIKFRIFDPTTNQPSTVISLHFRYFRYLWGGKT